MKKIFDKITNFFKEVRLELTKVTWTSKKELIGSTTVVIIVSLIFSIFVGIVDLGLSKIATQLLG